MEIVINWEVGRIEAKPNFTDKHGNLRTNVVKRVELICKGQYDGKEEEQSEMVSFDITDLSNFIESSNLTKSQILDWALSKINLRQKEYIEKLVKAKLGYYIQPSGINLEID